jgi:hypothetical protein
MKNNIKTILPILFIVLVSGHKAIADNAYSYTKWHVTPKGKKLSKTELKSYDAQNNLRKWVQYVNGGKSLTDSFAYEFKGELKIKEFRYSDGKLYTTTTFSYGKDNKVKSTKCFDKDNQIESSTKHKFFGNWELIQNYSSTGNLYSIDSLQYNQANKKTYEIQYLSDGSWFQRHRYEYDAKSSLIKSQTEANPAFDGIGLVVSVFTYNTINRPIKETVIFPDKTKENYIYIYSDKK